MKKQVMKFTPIITVLTTAIKSASRLLAPDLSPSALAHTRHILRISQCPHVLALYHLPMVANHALRLPHTQGRNTKQQSPQNL